MEHIALKSDKIKPNQSQNITQFYSSNGVDLAFSDSGNDGPGLVLVHGHPFNRTMWAPQIAPAAAAGWRVVAPDLRGYGESAVVPGVTPLDTFARDLAALLDHLDLERVVVVGLSMGGQIAMEFARLFPARLRGLVLAATFPQAETPDGKDARRQMAARLLADGMDGYADETLPKMLAAQTIASRPDIAAHVHEMMRRTSPAGAAAALLGRAERPPYDAVLASLKVPALVVVGDEDAFTTRADADRMHVALAGSELVWMAGVGHMPNLERTDAFNAALVDFLTRVDPVQ